MLSQVTVGDRNCKVESVSDNEIVCVVDSKPDEEMDMYPGGRGSRVVVVTHENVTFNDSESSRTCESSYLKAQLIPLKYK